MDSMDLQDKFDRIKKYFKYLILIIPILLLILLIKSCGGTNYKDVEKQMEESALNYIKRNNIVVNTETYIEISKLDEIEGTELCSKASGVIIKNNNGSLKATAYLDCDGYQSDIVKNKQKYIILNGEEVMTLNVGEAFNDPLYYLKKDAEVKVIGVVGTSPGVYTITYQAYVKNKLKETVTRKVIISEADKTTNVSGIDDKTKPSITLLGDKTMVLAVGSRYQEPGYLAVDYEDGKISRKVEVKGKVNTTSPGTYIITYSITNSRGVTALAIRTVKVVAQKSNLDILLTLDNESLSQKVNINLTISGDGYNYALLPNGARTLLRNTTYEVSKNGTYQVKVYDVYNNEYIKEIVVSNIDDIPPSGSCKAVVTSSKTTVEVNATDNKGVAGYSYIINGSATEFKTSNTYEAAIKAETVKVNVKDISGNANTLTCEIEEKNIISGGLCGASEVTVDIKTCFGNKIIRSKVPLEEYLAGVLYGEEAPSTTDSMEYIKAFVIFARTYSLRRGGYSSSSTLSLRSCSSDQNWCDYEQGCYRYQTDEMFDQCIEYSLSRKQYSSDGKSPYYDAATCANRVTTFPGTMQVSNKMYYVRNSAWPSNMASSAMSNRNVSNWHGKTSDSYRAFLIKAIEETAGLVIKTPDGKLASVGYYMCDKYTNGAIMCPNKAEELGNQGYTAEEIIKAYTQNYPEIVIECFNK